MGIADCRDIRIAELEAENERLRNQQALTFSDPPESYLVEDEQFQEHKRMIAELEDEIKILINTAVQFAIDAERYRFIRHYEVSVLDVDGDGNCVWIVNAEEFDELDEAIDAAINAAREG